MSTAVRRLGVVVFPGFELLDAFGPLEMFGNLQGLVEVCLVAQRARPVASAQGPSVIARLFGADTSRVLALGTEYEWHQDASWDPFAKAHGLV